MKDIARRTGFGLGLACLLAFGLVVFAVRYCIYAGNWVTFSGSPHVYSTSGTVDTGKVVDRSGTVLRDSATDSYAQDTQVRKATLHLLGDREGNIPNLIVRNYAQKLIGFDRINGTYHLTQGGGVCTLTVSADVQAIALKALNGRKGTVGVYNYKTGEILCAVSSPTYDPDNVPDIAGDTTGAYSGAYVNRFFQATYTPGSIFKVLTSTAAIEQIADIDSQSFTCQGTVVIGGETITCQKAHGTLDFREALAVSCNCTFADIANQLGADTLAQYAEKIGITSQLTFDGLTTVPGNFDLKDAGANDIAWAGIGQYTDLINPCQYMTFMGAIANGGTAAEPYIVSQVQCGNKKAYSASSSQTGKMLDTQTAEKLQSMMRYNVETVYGTGNFPKVNVCAKSGTAEVGEGQTPNATFAGYVTDAAYPLAFVVIVENGGAGSSACASVVGAVLQACINVMDGE